MTIDQINEIIARADGWTLSASPDLTRHPRFWRKKGEQTTIFAPTYHRAEDHPALLRVERERLGHFCWRIVYLDYGQYLVTLELGMGKQSFAANSGLEDLARADCVAQALLQQEKP